jgi:integrase/recombinase XerD
MQQLGTRPMTRRAVAKMPQRRLKGPGILGHYSPHSFRATGITNFLENGGSLEVAQRIAGHADSRTTKLYDSETSESVAGRHGAHPLLTA